MGYGDNIPSHMHRSIVSLGYEIVIQYSIIVGIIHVIDRYHLLIFSFALYVHLQIACRPCFRSCRDTPNQCSYMYVNSV